MLSPACVALLMLKLAVRPAWRSDPAEAITGVMYHANGPAAVCTGWQIDSNRETPAPPLFQFGFCSFPSGSAGSAPTPLPRAVLLSGLLLCGSRPPRLVQVVRSGVGKRKNSTGLPQPSMMYWFCGVPLGNISWPRLEAMLSGSSALLTERAMSRHAADWVSILLTRTTVPPALSLF